MLNFSKTFLESLGGGTGPVPTYAPTGWLRHWMVVNALRWFTVSRTDGQVD